MPHDPLSATPATHGEVADEVRALGEVVWGGGVIGGIITGTGAPPSGSGLDPLDGVSDPWRWSDIWGGWVSPAYEVTWSGGAQMPAVAIGRDFVLVEDSAPTLTTPTTYAAGTTIGSPGSGVAYVVQYEDGFTHTQVPNPTLDVEALFADFTFGAVYDFSDESVGADGQFYLDTNTLDLYGPRVDGVWAKISTLPPPA